MSFESRVAQVSNLFQVFTCAFFVFFNWSLPTLPPSSCAVLLHMTLEENTARNFIYVILINI